MLPFGPIESTFAVDDFIIPETTLSVVLGGSNLSEYVLEYSCSGSRGGGISGYVKLKDRDDFIAKLVSQFSFSSSSMKGHNMTDGVVLYLSVSQGSSNTEYPHLLPGDPEWDGDGTVTFNFTDKSPIVDLENQNVGDYAYDGPSFSVTAHDIISDAATLTGEAINPTFPDFRIQTYRANETSIASVLEDMCSVYQAYRKWDGATLTLERLNEGKSSRGHIIDRKHILEGSFSAGKFSSRVKTFFKHIKDNPLGSVLGEASCTGKLGTQSQCVGRVVSINFNRPVERAWIQWEAFRGDIQDGVFFDEGDTPLNMTPSFVIVNADPPAVRWLGTYVPAFVMNEMYVPGWNARAFTTPDNTDLDDWILEKAVTIAESLYGRRPEYKNLESQLLRDESAASAMLDAIALEVSWGINEFRLSTPWLFEGREGDFLNVTHTKSGISNVKCIINDWSHSFSYENGWNNTYTLGGKI